jgi:hypothetical protein
MSRAVETMGENSLWDITGSDSDESSEYSEGNESDDEILGGATRQLTFVLSILEVQCDVALVSHSILYDWN